MTLPLPLRIGPHPYLAERFTHLPTAADARRRHVWFVVNDVPLGIWRTRPAASRAARQLEERGEATFKEVRP